MKYAILLGFFIGFVAMGLIYKYSFFSMELVCPITEQGEPMFCTRNYHVDGNCVIVDGKRVYCGQYYILKEQ